MYAKRIVMCGLTATALLAVPGILTADDPLDVATADDASDVDWERKYEQLLRDRPEIRRKVESGQATREQVLQWLMDGGDSKKPERDYYGTNIEIEDPADFQNAKGEVVYSGPQPGERLPAFNATGIRGDRDGEEFNPVSIADGGPLVLIFQDNSVVGQKGLLLCGQALARIAERSPDGLHVSATFLVDDRTTGLLFEYDFMDKIDEVIEMSVSPDRRDGPGIYGLNRNVGMTIIVAKDSRVLHNFVFIQPMLYPDPHVFGAIAEAIGVERETVAGWLREPAEDDEKQ